MAEGLCWCASESKCPHGISTKIPLMWDDMEKIVDDVLQQFDRKTIRKFLKRETDGTPKVESVQESYKGGKSKVSKTKNPGSDFKTLGSPDRNVKKSRTDDGILSKTAPAALTQFEGLDMRRPGSAEDFPQSGPDTASRGENTNNSTLPSNLKQSKSQAQLPTASFQRNLMANSLPKLPNARVVTSTSYDAGDRSASPEPAVKVPKTAWGPETSSSPQQSRPRAESYEPPRTNAAAVPSSSLPVDLPGETSISVGLMRIVDQLARKVLPWQAVLCPRAVETLHDLRQSIIQNKHNQFIASMKAKLEEKVMSFISKKDEEVDIWIERELRSWKTFMEHDEVDLTEFIKNDLARITDRGVRQDEAYRRRELIIATTIDDHERDTTRDQLVTFRRICRADRQGEHNGGSLVEVRVLQDSIAKAQSVTKKQAAKSHRDVVRKIEESHDWLSSLADNAITAGLSEETLKGLYASLDNEKAKGIESVQTALAAYKEQHNAILEAITVFAGRIQQHCFDYLQREQLVSRGFLQYTLGIVTGEIKTHTTEHKKNTFAWEAKSAADRGHRKEQALIIANTNPLDAMVNEFKDRMRVQLDHVTMKLQSILNGRENDINARKAVIHKKLAKHVNKACNARRQRLKDATQIRRDEYELEEKCIQSVDELCFDLRSAIDQIWVKEHLKERRMYEAAAGRMERLEKSALIIWNKHSHLAISQKEDYEEMISKYKEDRDKRMNERKEFMEREWRSWRMKYGEEVKQITRTVRADMKSFLFHNYEYEVSVPVEKNLEDLESSFTSILGETCQQISMIRSMASNYLKNGMRETDQFAAEKRDELMKDWQHNLHILNTAVNRRIGGLKDMEADLEETVRLVILQHEVENVVFEQLSCTRLEQFWLEWRSKMFQLSKQLMERQDDYQISKKTGKAKSRSDAKDRALDDLVALAKDRTGGGGGGGTLPAIHSSPMKNTYKHGTTGGGAAGAEVFNQSSLAEQSELTGSVLKPTHRGVSSSHEDNNNTDFVDLQANHHSDTLRLKRILEEIKPEIYREYAHKMTRGLEKVRRDLGEGKHRLVPPYAVTKILLQNADAFWERAKLSERCIGRISSKGLLLFKDGLPMHARAMFSVASSLYILSNLHLKNYKMDCDDVFEQIENIKKAFMIGLLTVSLQVGEFGDYFLRNECLWACSIFQIDPPPELVKFSDAKGLSKEGLDDQPPTGFYSEDPVDLLNNVVCLTTELAEVQRLTTLYQHELQEQGESLFGDPVPGATTASAQDLNQSSLEIGEKSTVLAEDSLLFNNNSMGMSMELPGTAGGVGSVEEKFNTRNTPNFNNTSNFNSTVLNQSSIDAEVDDILSMGNNAHYRSENVKLLNAIKIRKPLLKTLNRLAFMLPSVDLTILCGMLGRPDGSMDMTPHRICQIVSLWRRTAIAMITATFDPPSTEYPRIQDLVTEHHSSMMGRKRMGQGNIACMSPYESVSSAIDWVTSIKGVPISVNQALCLLSRGGSCDPWIEDPKQTGRQQRIIYEINEMLDIFSCNIPKSMIHDERLQVAFQPHMLEYLRKLDLNYNGCVPIELLRTFIQREEIDLTNTQITIIYWSLSRVNDDVDDMVSAEYMESKSLHTNNTGGAYKPIVKTVFQGDPDDYMDKFAVDVHKYLDSMPTIDTSVVTGTLVTPLVPASAHELVSDAMKLDISARNIMPTTCCVWLGQRTVELNDAINALTVKDTLSKDGGMLLGIGENSFHGRCFANRWLADIRTYVEMDLLTKFPELCEIRASDKHYGPAGNEPISEEDHWRELTNRRLGRMDKLTLSWRNIMLNEWATSLYQSRQQRYIKRVDIVKQCVGVYHKQYGNLEQSIVKERGALLRKFDSVERELLTLIQEFYNFYTYHVTFLEQSLNRYESQFTKFFTLLYQMVYEFQRHCGIIKRHGIERINNAFERLRHELETSCNGLITGYTIGYAQAYFDDLVKRGDLWTAYLMQMHARVITEKEKFITAKDEVDRDLTIQLTDRLTLDRNRTKGHLEYLAEQTAKMLDVVASTRASYAAIQKDANARLVLRIEKAVRESRKLRVAAEQQAELEQAAMRDIRVVLDTARTSCVTIVEQINEACLKQLHAIEPQRVPHRERMEHKVKLLKQGWVDCEAALLPLVDDYERELFKHLGISNTHCMDFIHEYQDTEVKALQEKHYTERTRLITSFRKHFREYDLTEGAIFERFNNEVVRTVNDMNRMWGPSRPKFIANGLTELRKIIDESLESGSKDVVQNIYRHSCSTDDITLQRMELTDIGTYSLSKCYEYAKSMSVQYVREKKAQLECIDEMSMARNGDMVRPQVKAVLDLLIAGIEIDADFTKGYDNLVVQTNTKAEEALSDLQDYVDRYSNPENHLSIGFSANLTRGRIERRRQEVQALLDASNAHLIADHSRLDVLVNAGEKDIEEWTSLTMQLVENAFHNAEVNYLSNLWPTPPATPRIEMIPEEEDRVGKLKALLAATNAGNFAGAGAGAGAGNGMALIPTDLIMPEDADDIARRLQREQKRAEKEERKRLKEEQRRLSALKTEPPPLVKPKHTRELQDGWFECFSPEGYLYYFHPDTGESLWQLPAALREPLYPDEDDLNNNSLIDTPRDLLMLEDRNIVPEMTPMMRIVPAEFSLRVALDPKVIMSSIAEEARAVSEFVVDTAVDITAVIKGKKGKDFNSIVQKLGDKYDPMVLHNLETRMLDDLSKGKHKLTPQQLASAAAEEEQEETRSVDSIDQINKYGRLISDTSSRVDSETADMLLQLSMGLVPAPESVPMPPIQEEVTAAKMLKSEKDKWMALGLGGGADGDSKYDRDDSSDDESRFATADEARKYQDSMKFAQTRETQLMAAEEELSIAYENLMEDTYCKEFMGLFAGIMQAQAATPEDRIRLWRLGSAIKPINANEIMSVLKTSWATLDDIIGQTRAREIERKVTAERLRTEEGMKRQQMILERSEDIEDMAQFFVEAGLSKSIAKRVATDAVLKNISTAKKFAKIWSRQHLTLEEFGIDRDDMEDVELALKKLLATMSKDTMEINASFNTTMMSMSSFAATKQQLQQSDAMAQLNHSLQLEGVVEVEEVDIDSRDPSRPDTRQDPRSVASSRKSSRAGLGGGQSFYKYSLTKEGYKSFRDGWIEGYSDNNHVYYYNTETGESSWHLPPEIAEGDESQEEGGMGGEDSQVIQPWQAEGSLYSDINQQVAIGLPPPVAAVTPHHTHPTNSFEQFTHTDYAQYDYNQQHQQYQQQEYDPAEYGHYGDYTQGYGHDAQHSYDPHAAAGEHAAYYQHWDETNRPYYDEHSGQWYDPLSQQYYDYDPSAYAHYEGGGGGEGYGEYGQHQHDGYYNHDGTTYEGGDEHYAQDATQQQQQRQPVDVTGYEPPPKPRTLPVPIKPEVAAYCKHEGVARQLELLNAQDRWQNSLVKSQHFITEQKSLYLQRRVEMFDKVTKRVESRLNGFVDDIKFMQKNIRKDLGESNATERDLRRLFEDRNSQSVVQAEKLSFILESLEKFKVVLGERYESAFKQIEKFSADWELIKAELLQIGEVYDEGVASNLEQCRLACEHNAKVFAYDQLKATAALRKIELSKLKVALRKELRKDSKEAEEARAVQRREMLKYYREREIKREQVRRELGGPGWWKTIEAEVVAAGFPAIDQVTEPVPEEESVMSYMLTHLEMDASLSSDYDSITDATKSMAIELQAGIKEFDEKEKKGVKEDGSWYNKHRETIERHEAALNVTLNKVLNRVNEGYKTLQAQVDALDFEVEHAAEEELFQGN